MECHTFQSSSFCSVFDFHIVNITICIPADGIKGDFSAPNIIESQLGFGAVQFNVRIIHTDADDMLLYIMITKRNRHKLIRHVTVTHNKIYYILTELR